MGSVNLVVKTTCSVNRRSVNRGILYCYFSLKSLHVDLFYYYNKLITHFIIALWIIQNEAI